MPSILPYWISYRYLLESLQKRDLCFNIMLINIAFSEQNSQWKHSGRNHLSAPVFVLTCNFGNDSLSLGWAHKCPNNWQVEGLCLLEFYCYPCVYLQRDKWTSFLSPLHIQEIRAIRIPRYLVRKSFRKLCFYYSPWGYKESDTPE